MSAVSKTAITKAIQRYSTPQTPQINENRALENVQVIHKKTKKERKKEIEKQKHETKKAELSPNISINILNIV